MEQPVDRQAWALYNAQFEAFVGTELHSYLTTTECIGFNRVIFDRARANNYWHAAYVPAIEVVQIMPDASWAGCAFWNTDTVTGAYIHLKPEGRLGWVIAHEAAHILLKAGRTANAKYENHGKEYAAVFIWAISALFGKKWSNRLKRAFAAGHVEAACSLKED